MKDLVCKDTGELPPGEELVSNLIWMKTVTQIAAGSTIGKTHLMIHLAICVATGTPFMGEKTRQCKVLYVCAEGAEGIEARLLGNLKELGLKPESIIENLVMYPKPFNITNSKNREVLVKWCQEKCEDGNLLILDTAARCTEGMDENGNDDITALYNAMNEIISNIQTPLSIVFSHHVGKKNDPNGRGGSAWYDNADQAFTIKKVDSLRHLESTKQKDRPQPLNKIFDLVNHPADSFEHPKADKKYKYGLPAVKFLKTGKQTDLMRD